MLVLLFILGLCQGTRLGFDGSGTSTLLALFTVYGNDSHSTNMHFSLNGTVLATAKTDNHTMWISRSLINSTTTRDWKGLYDVGLHLVNSIKVENNPLECNVLQIYAVCRATHHENDWFLKFACDGVEGRFKGSHDNPWYETKMNFQEYASNEPQCEGLKRWGDGCLQMLKKLTEPNQPVYASKPFVYLRATRVGGLIHLSCHARGYRPDDIEIKFGTKRTQTTSVAFIKQDSRPSGDGTYQSRTTVITTSTAVSEWICYINHPGSGTTIATKIGEDISDETDYIFIATIIVYTIVVILAIVLYRTYKQTPTSPSPDLLAKKTS